MKYVHSKNYDKSRLLEVLSLDDIVYDKKLTGTFESVSSRYKTNEEMFIFAINEENKMCGYICFFPISDVLCNKIDNEYVMFDDNISAKDVEQYSKSKKNNIFVISVAIFPEYRGKGIGFNLVKEMFSYLGSLSILGYEIGKIYAISTSVNGERLLSKFNFQKIRNYDDKGLLLKYDFICYKNMDLYFFVPVKLNEHFERKMIPNDFINSLAKTWRAEVNSLMNERIERYFIGKVRFCPEDDYGNAVKTKILDSNMYLSSYKDIGTLIIEIPSISFDPTFVLDQSSRNSLKVISADNSELLLSEYLSTIGLDTLGNPNHLLVSGNPLNSYYRQFVLYGESYFNRIGSRIISKEAQNESVTNIAQYEFAEIYSSGVGVIFEFDSNTPSKTYDLRLQTSILIIFIFEILALELASLRLVQNTITREFDNSPKPSLEIIEELIDNFGKYIILFEYNYKYHLAKCLSDKIAERFNINGMRKDYQSNVEQLNRIVTIRSERISKEFSKKQELLFKIVSIFTLLLSINNVISLFVGVDFTSKIELIIFVISITIWGGAVIYLVSIWIKRLLNKSRAKE